MPNEDIDPWKIPIKLNDAIEGNDKYKNTNNSISTTKYTLLSWLPVSLLEQFRRLANAYFLIISVLMLIGTYAPHVFQTPLNPYTTVLTLVFVLLVTSIKEGYEDLQRYKYDSIENSRKVTIITFDDRGCPVETIKYTKEIKIGDIVKLSGRSVIPVDMVLMYTSNFADNNQCYVETMNIDGETNLKLRLAPSLIQSLSKSSVLTKEIFSGSIEFEPPNKNIHTFVGALYLDALKEATPLNQDNLLLRSSIFASTEWGYGVAVYTGQNTKVQLNTIHMLSKQSRLEMSANFAVLLIFIAQITLVSFAVIFIYVLGYNNFDKYNYIYTESNVSQSSVLPLWLERWFIIFLLLNNFIPISLYITLEMINIGQSFLVSHDILLYDADTDSPCIVKSSNMCQELGCITHLFSDKTGTLTRNEMIFVQFMIENVLYETSNKDPFSTAKASSQEEFLDKFLLCLGICHTVVREKDGSFRAESPDELALIKELESFGVEIVDRLTNSITLKFSQTKREFKILGVNSFDADRKRMSVLAYDLQKDEYVLLCKGADSIMMELCTFETVESKVKTEKSLFNFACQGLRTLCIAYKLVPKEEALLWVSGWKEAANSIVDRPLKMSEIGAKIEKDMKILGITAIEDRLQDEVPEVLADLAKAGITLWMLTGDKEETAVNIGRSCNLIYDTTYLFSLTNLKSRDDFKAKLSETHNDILSNYKVGDRNKDSHSNSQSNSYSNIKNQPEKVNIELSTYQDKEKLPEVKEGGNNQIALIIDGPSFKYFEENDIQQRKELLSIAQSCRSVIACRLTPVQKQMLVHLVKKESVPRAITLAIGDGANDVSMIREADVGVGIIGKEGRQAANNSDFAIGQFKFLRRLLLVHGRWNNIRESKAFLYCMHKNMVITIILFWYSFYNTLSGTSPFESWLYGSYNFALGWPIVFLGVFDRDISADFALSVPETYISGRGGAQLSSTVIISSILNAALYAIFIGLIIYVCMFDTFKEYGIFEYGTLIFFTIVNSLQLKVSFMLHQWNILNFLAMLVSVGGLFLLAFALSNISDSLSEGYYKVTEWISSRQSFWIFGHILIPIVCLLLDIIEHCFKYFFFPTNEILFREIEQNSNKKKISIDKIIPT